MNNNINILLEYQKQCADLRKSILDAEYKHNIFPYELHLTCHSLANAENYISVAIEKLKTKS